MPATECVSSRKISAFHKFFGHSLQIFGVLEILRALRTRSRASALLQRQLQISAGRFLAGINGVMALLLVLSLYPLVMG
ncbi:hypothetical protein [Pseudomonas syringae]